MAENAARVAWADAGLMVPWRLTSPSALRLAVRRLLGSETFRAHAAEIARSGGNGDGAERGADLVEDELNR
jgi:UDP:flavonoid glycosyltransferase YjiC (YdhE family)